LLRYQDAPFDIAVTNCQLSWIVSDKATLGRFTLIALVIGNMLGAGVFTTSGFAMGDLGSPVYVLEAVIALCMSFVSSDSSSAGS
jgi:amino acid transporter